MVKQKFPFNFFYNMVSPIRSFSNRKSLSWPQIILMFIFLSALMVLPIPFHYQHTQDISMSNYLPQVDQLLGNQQLQKEIKQADYHKQAFNFGGSKVLKRTKKQILGIDLTQQQVANYETVVNVRPKYIYLKEKRTTNKLWYSSLHNMQQGSFRKQVNWLWYQGNKGAIAFSMLIIIGSVVVLTNIMLVFLAAVFIWMTRKSPYMTIKTYRESVCLMLYTIGLSSLIVTLVGFIDFDISIMLILQMIICSMMLLLVYAKTHFNDQYVENRK